MDGDISRDDLLLRQDSAVGNHYLSLSVTVVGLGLAAAAAALASLVSQFASLGSNLLILSLLWLGGLLCVAVAYAGPMVGAFALPRSVPVMRDLLPPLGLGISEFLIFAVFLHSFRPKTNISPMLLTWFAAMFLFGFCAIAVIVRARSIFIKSRGSYSRSVLPIIDSYIDYMTLSIQGPALLMTISIVGFISWYKSHNKWAAYVFAALITADLIIGLWFHDQQARPWQALLSGDAETEPLRIIKLRLEHIREQRRHIHSISASPTDPALPSRPKDQSPDASDTARPGVDIPEQRTPANGVNADGESDS